MSGEGIDSGGGFGYVSKSRSVRSPKSEVRGAVGVCKINCVTGDRPIVRKHRRYYDQESRSRSSP